MKLLFQLFWTFFKIGTFTFGSGYAMIPMIEREVVDKKKWFEKEDFYNQFTLASSAPGPFALNTAVFVGYKVCGWWGSLAAVIGATLPSFTIIILIAVYFTEIRNNPTVEAAFKGLMPAVTAMIAVPFIRMLLRLKWYFIPLALAVMLLIWMAGISPVYFILIGGATGLLTAYFRK